MSIAAAVIFHVLTCVRMLQISSGLCKIICSLLRIEDPAFVHSLLRLICSLAEAPTARKVTTSATDTSLSIATDCKGQCNTWELTQHGQVMAPRVSGVLRYQDDSRNLWFVDGMSSYDS